MAQRNQINSATNPNPALNERELQVDPNIMDEDECIHECDRPQYMIRHQETLKAWDRMFGTWDQANREHLAKVEKEERRLAFDQGWKGFVSKWLPCGVGAAAGYLTYSMYEEDDSIQFGVTVLGATMGWVLSKAWMTKWRKTYRYY